LQYLTPRWVERSGLLGAVLEARNWIPRFTGLVVIVVVFALLVLSAWMRTLAWEFDDFRNIQGRFRLIRK
jgi:hypothetical protein